MFSTDSRAIELSACRQGAIESTDGAYAVGAGAGAIEVVGAVLVAPEVTFDPYQET